MATSYSKWHVSEKAVSCNSIFHIKWWNNFLPSRCYYRILNSSCWNNCTERVLKRPQNRHLKQEVKAALQKGSCERNKLRFQFCLKIRRTTPWHSRLGKIPEATQNRKLHATTKVIPVMKLQYAHVLRLPLKCLSFRKQQTQHKNIFKKYIFLLHLQM